MITSFRGEYRFLSNFFPAVVEFDDVFYPSVEHAYCAAKTLDYGARVIFANPNLYAGDAKRHGRHLSLRPDWLSFKLPLMRSLITQKFQSPDLLRQLLATDPHELIEGNTWGDRYWGMCNGVGENHLGKILMSLRADRLKMFTAM